MDKDNLWKSVLAEIELSVSKPIFKTQFATSEIISFENNVATVGFANPMVREMVETRYFSLLKTIFDAHTKANTSIVFSVLPKREKLSPQNTGPLFVQTLPQETKDVESVARHYHIRPELTFETFAVSSTNQIAYAAATAVSKAPGAAYNPLFFYGGVGVGKTHLMHAIANMLLAKKPSTKIVYCMGDEFLNDIIEAIQTKSSRLFKQKYRSAQLLMVDDVQFIAGKQTAQEEFFHTFNAVLREGGQIVLTSDRPPSEISRLEDRLRSRFEGGLLVDINQPDFELRTAIVNIKAGNLNLVIPSAAAQMIAANTTDARAIEGFLMRVMTEKSAGKEVSLELVASLLGKNNGQQASGPAANRKRISPQEVLEEVARFFDIKPTAIKGAKRDRPIARPRQMVMYLCKTELGLTLEDIGGLLGGRDHTTIMHGVDTITRELSTNQRLREAMEGIKTKLWV